MDECGSSLLASPLSSLIITARGGFSGPSNPERTDVEEKFCLGHSVLPAFLGPLRVIITAIRRSVPVSVLGPRSRGFSLLTETGLSKNYRAGFLDEEAGAPRGKMTCARSQAS